MIHYGAKTVRNIAGCLMLSLCAYIYEHSYTHYKFISFSGSLLEFQLIFGIH